MDAEQIVRILTDPAVYPHQCGDIEVIETHISWVFLTGEFAYKVKKPVDFGFLNFSSLDKRRYFCEQELTRNQVFSGDVYQSVLALKQEGESYHLSCELEGGLEYLVKMKQFSQSELLSCVIDGADFSPQQAHSLGLSLADLHNRIESAGSMAAWGSPEAIGYPITENFAQIEPLINDSTDLQSLQRLKTWSLAQLDGLNSQFEERKQNGFVRACHGDLHLNNILWRDDGALSFDCIEFNDEFRWIDVMSELAFLLMDMEHQGYDELANHCLNGYLEQSGDYEGVALLNFYKVYRALVRAKVAILRLQQAAEEEKQQLYKSYLSYVELAEQYTQKTQPCLYITHGVSGSGKSTMARFVSGKINAVHIRSDVERKRLFGITANQNSGSTLDAGIYTQEATQRTFSRLEQVTSGLINAGYSVIVDATFLRQSVRRQFRYLGEQLKVPFAILDCAIDEETARNRIRARMAAGQDASEADLQVLERQLCDQDYLSPEEQRCCVVIDMGKPLEDIELETLIRAEHLAD
ncbi:MAG: AAA family ATPase [Pseudomonadales bacterium]|nr:AAA family ATPase [Pseudomonadales bacterium]